MVLFEFQCQIAMLLAILTHLSYAEYRKLIPKCSNSCLGSGDVPPTNCYCDVRCSMFYNDCCIDAPYRTIRGATTINHNQTCVFVHGENKHFWLMDKCKDTWSGHVHIREKCTENGVVSGDSSDIVGSIPVTDSIAGITYKNYYCAMCNGKDIDGLLEWQVKALCKDSEVTQEEVLQNLTFVEDLQQWGVWKQHENGEVEFHVCYLLFQAPFNVTKGVRTCNSGMVSSCPGSWQNIAVRRKCKSYVDPVKWSDGPVYRNIDCAMCNNRTRQGYRCVYDAAKESNAIMLDRAMSIELSQMGQWF